MQLLLTISALVTFPINAALLACQDRALPEGDLVDTSGQVALLFLMQLHHLFGLKGFVAHFAFEGLLTCVGSHVLNEGLFQGEHFATELTGAVLFHARVGQHVFVQVGDAQKAVTTHFADLVAHLHVRLSYMSVHVLLFICCIGTQLTVKVILLSVLLHV